MTSLTPYYSLKLYSNTTPDTLANFLDWRMDVSGTISGSNMNLIDTAMNGLQTQITSLSSTRGAIPVPATFVSGTDYTATVASITAYNTDMLIALRLNATNPGTTLLNINALGAKALMKVDSAGGYINLVAGDLKITKEYIFRYDGTRWVWISATSGDQINVVGTSGNLLSIYGTNNTIVDSGVGLNVSGGVPTLDAGLKLNASRVPITDGLYISGTDIAARVDGTSIILLGTTPTKTISHADTSSQASVTNTGYTVLQSAGVDAYGHVTSLASKGVGATYSADGRLSFATLTPIPAVDITNAANLYYTLYIGDQIALYDTTGSKWDFLTFTETSLALTSLTPNCMYSVYGYNNSGTLALELESWGTNTSYNISAATAADPCVITYSVTDGLDKFAIDDSVCIQGITGNIGSDALHTVTTVTSIAGGSGNNRKITVEIDTSGKTYTSGGTVRKLYNTVPVIARQNGVVVKSGDASRRLLGFMLTSGEGLGTDTAAERYLANEMNQVSRPLRAIGDYVSAATQTGVSGVYQLLNVIPNATKNGCGRFAFVTGTLPTLLNAHWVTGIKGATNALSVIINLSLNSILLTSSNQVADAGFGALTEYVPATALINRYPSQAGFNYVQTVLFCTTGNSITVYVGKGTMYEFGQGGDIWI